MTKVKVSNVVFLLINLLTVILLFTLVDYFTHELKDTFSVPPHYFWNKVPAAFGLAVIGLLLSIKIKSVWLKALVTGGFTAVLLQGKYFIQGYPLDFVFLFLLLHFLMLYPLLVLMFCAYNKYNQPNLSVMRKIFVSLLVLIIVSGTTYYVVFKDLPREDDETETYNYEFNSVTCDTSLEGKTDQELQRISDQCDRDIATQKAILEKTQNTSTMTEQTPVQSVPKPASVIVHIKNFAFNPSSLSIETGTKVTWVNEDSVSHTVTSDSGSLLNSGLIPPGGSFDFTFSNPVSESYHCVPHPMMKGSVVVIE